MAEKTAHTALIEHLERAAIGQKEYFAKKQQEFPCIDDYFDADGLLHLPDDIGPLLSGIEANGRYSEADWWLSTIRALSRAKDA